MLYTAAGAHPAPTLSDELGVSVPRQRFTLFTLLLFLAFLIFLPIFFSELMAGSLIKLHLTPDEAMAITIAIIVGGLINIPVGRIQLQQETVTDPMAIFGLSGFMPGMRRTSHDTIIAVNVGGCIIPTLLAIYELTHLNSGALNAALIVAAINSVVCFSAARVVSGVGIVIPGLIPPLVAALGALIFARDQAAPVAFIAGVAGPLIGADLFHLRDIKASPVGIASIGGAGTFDGIVLSGIIAAYLA